MIVICFTQTKQISIVISLTAFYVVCTDVETGKAVYQLIEKGGDEAYDWIRASASMPVVSKIVELNGRKLLDGGVSDSIPLQFFEREGYERNIVILTQPAGYQKKKNPFLPLMRFLMTIRLFQFYKDYAIASSDTINGSGSIF